MDSKRNVPSEYRRHLGRKIKKLLIDMDVSQSEFARTLGLSVTYFNKILNGKTAGLRYRERIEAALAAALPAGSDSRDDGTVFDG